MVNICYNGVWGGICDADADITEGYTSERWHISSESLAKVTCDSLDY